MYINNVNILEIYKKLVNSYLNNSSLKSYFSQYYDLIYDKLYSQKNSS